MRRHQERVDALSDALGVHAVSEYLKKKYRYGDAYSLIFLAGCNLGLRASDLLRLTVGIFDDGGGTIVEKKTSKSRQIIINDALRRVYAKYRSERGVIFWDRSATVAASIRGPGLTPKYLHYLIAEACESLGYAGRYGSHTMRKTFAQAIYEMTGGSLDAVRLLLHHSTPRITTTYITDETLTDEITTTIDWNDYDLAQLYNLIAFE